MKKQDLINVLNAKLEESLKSEARLKAKHETEKTIILALMASIGLILASQTVEQAHAVAETTTLFLSNQDCLK
jgi:hypothetical protein